MKFRGRAGWLLLIELMASVLGVSKARGQQPAPYTLHVYEDTIQIPVLVLSRNRQMMGPLAGNKFSVSLDSGRPFRATHVRREGDDPISLAILVNLSGQDWPMLTDMDRVFGLTGKDHVSVFVVACGLMRVLDDVLADSERLKHIAEDGFRVWKERNKADCKEPPKLRDDMVFAVHELAKAPGRRVLLTITDEEDSRSNFTWNDLRIAALGSGTAIFGMRVVSLAPGEDQFDVLCQLTGGVSRRVNGRAMGEGLNEFTAMLRGRYIVEFPRPARFSTGAHSIQVTIAGAGDAYVRASGLVVPLQDPKVAADPTTVLGDPEKTPELGTRRAMPR